MGRTAKPLTDTQCKNAKFVGPTPTRLWDGGGLFLEVLSSGSKRWRMRY
ncbi:Arm DNA-binding domain-containing protein, partial [Cupriavidus taiwanensis]